ncbi:tetratricopeptide repeat protein [Marinobacter nanhaiticus]|nr:tetratricopeptide repeat protein [Marinobacter nanhaiticus]
MAEEAPRRVHDLQYGTVLYEHFQGHSFEALTRFAVAEKRGGIQGHGDHPKLVQGGIMLAYGMTREARDLYESLLDEAVTPEARNQAWFYLGKVFYLEGDNSRAADALGRVDGEILEDDDEPLYHEWLYLKGQLALRTQGRDAAEIIDIVTGELPEESLWKPYLGYNLAVQQMAAGETESAVRGLNAISVQLQEALPELEEEPEEPDEADLSDEDRQERADDRERRALFERVRLSLGQLYLQQGNYAAALENLAAISLDSVFSDEALYHYAVAASEAQSWGLALQVLETLQQRTLFSPWLQQVPYARGYVYEQLERPQTALAAYREAADHYQSLVTRLQQASRELSESEIIEGLRFEVDAGEDEALQRANLSLGDPRIANDSYGRLQVEPGNFSLAFLLSRESFQMALRDLHELYQLKRRMQEREQQLASFDVMLETRAQLRERKIRETRDSLESLGAEAWSSQQSAYNRLINEAADIGDVAFFMSDKQKDLAARIEEVEDTLAVLPDNRSTAEQRRKFARMKAYFQWQLADDFAVNRWAAEKQLRQLNAAMDTFDQQRTTLAEEMTTDRRQTALAERVEESQRRVAAVEDKLDQALAQARHALVAQVREELVRQQREVERFLLASRHGQARLADALFQAGGRP